MHIFTIDFYVKPTVGLTDIVKNVLQFTLNNSIWQSTSFKLMVNNVILNFSALVKKTSLYIWRKLHSRPKKATN